MGDDHEQFGGESVEEFKQALDPDSTKGGTALSDSNKAPAPSEAPEKDPYLPENPADIEAALKNLEADESSLRTLLTEQTDPSSSVMTCEGGRVLRINGARLALIRQHVKRMAVECSQLIALNPGPNSFSDSPDGGQRFRLRRMCYFLRVVVLGERVQIAEHPKGIPVDEDYIRELASLEPPIAAAAGLTQSKYFVTISNYIDTRLGVWCNFASQVNVVLEFSSQSRSRALQVFAPVSKRTPRPDAESGSNPLDDCMRTVDRSEAVAHELFSGFSRLTFDDADSYLAVLEPLQAAFGTYLDDLTFFCNALDGSNVDREALINAFAEKNERAVRIQAVLFDTAPYLRYMVRAFEQNDPVIDKVRDLLESNGMAETCRELLKRVGAIILRKDDFPKVKARREELIRREAAEKQATRKPAQSRTRGAGDPDHKHTFVLGPGELPGVLPEASRGNGSGTPSSKPSAAPPKNGSTPQRSPDPNGSRPTPPKDPAQGEAPPANKPEPELPGALRPGVSFFGLAPDGGRTVPLTYENDDILFSPLTLPLDGDEVQELSQSDPDGRRAAFLREKAEQHLVETRGIKLGPVISSGSTKTVFKGLVTNIGKKVVVKMSQRMGADRDTVVAREGRICEELSGHSSHPTVIALDQRVPGVDILITEMQEVPQVDGTLFAELKRGMILKLADLEYFETSLRAFVLALDEAGDDEEAKEAAASLLPRDFDTQRMLRLCAAAKQCPDLECYRALRKEVTAITRAPTSENLSDVYDFVVAYRDAAMKVALFEELNKGAADGTGLVAMLNILRDDCPPELRVQVALGVWKDLAGGIDHMHNLGWQNNDIATKNVALGAPGKYLVALCGAKFAKDLGVKKASKAPRTFWGLLGDSDREKFRAEHSDVPKPPIDPQEATVAAFASINRDPERHWIVMIDQDVTTKLGERQRLGTKDYVDPEWYGKEQDTGRRDLYGLGMTIYHILTGELPFANWDGIQIGNLYGELEENEKLKGPASVLTQGLHRYAEVLDGQDLVSPSTMKWLIKHLPKELLASLRDLLTIVRPTPAIPPKPEDGHMHADDHAYADHEPYRDGDMHESLEDAPQHADLARARAASVRSDTILGSVAKILNWGESNASDPSFATMHEQLETAFGISERAIKARDRRNWLIKLSPVFATVFIGLLAAGGFTIDHFFYKPGRRATEAAAALVADLRGDMGTARTSADLDKILKRITEEAEGGSYEDLFEVEYGGPDLAKLYREAEMKKMWLSLNEVITFVNHTDFEVTGKGDDRGLGPVYGPPSKPKSEDATESPTASSEPALPPLPFPEYPIPDPDSGDDEAVAGQGPIARDKSSEGGVELPALAQPVDLDKLRQMADLLRDCEDRAEKLFGMKGCEVEKVAALAAHAKAGRERLADITARASYYDSLRKHFAGDYDAIERALAAERKGDWDTLPYAERQAAIQRRAETLRSGMLASLATARGDAWGDVTEDQQQAARDVIGTSAAKTFDRSYEKILVRHFTGDRIRLAAAYALARSELKPGNASKPSEGRNKKWEGYTQQQRDAARNLANTGVKVEAERGKAAEKHFGGSRASLDRAAETAKREGKWSGLTEEETAAAKVVHHESKTYSPERLQEAYDAIIETGIILLPSGKRVPLIPTGKRNNKPFKFHPDSFENPDDEESGGAERAEKDKEPYFVTSAEAAIIYDHFKELEKLPHPYNVLAHMAYFEIVMKAAFGSTNPKDIDLSRYVNFGKDSTTGFDETGGTGYNFMAGLPMIAMKIFYKAVSDIVESNSAKQTFLLGGGKNFASRMYSLLTAMELKIYEAAVAACKKVNATYSSTDVYDSFSRITFSKFVTDEITASYTKVRLGQFEGGQATFGQALLSRPRYQTPKMRRLIVSHFAADPDERRGFIEESIAENPMNRRHPLIVALMELDE